MTRVFAGVPLFLCLLVVGCGGPAAPPPAPPAAADFNVVEASIPDIQAALQSGRITSRQLTEKYLQRIALYEDRLNAIITVNPRALAEADALDQERKAGKVRGPLHGITVLVKDNIDTGDKMMTTAGSL
ncbi:MAG: hypothetical protein IT181_09180, partial [Acidobacteria bacterium]|nr:hypothetical protein [Acidobacteriota bacterium]